MIKLLQRYIAKTIILATGLAALMIAGVLFLMSLLGELKNLGEGDYGIGQAIIYVFLRLPGEIYQFSPMLILLGSIIGLSILSAHRELSVMRASGYSVRQIIYSVLGAALCLIIFISVFGEWMAPGLTYTAAVRKENARNGGQAVVTAAGVWFHVDNNFIHVKHVVGRDLLEGVTRYQFDDRHQLRASYYAKTLAYKNDQWQMNEVVKTTFFDDRTHSQSFPEAPWDLKFNSNLLNIGLLDPNDMSLPRLVNYSSYLKQNGLQASEYQFEFWQRIFQPLASLIMIFLAISFVLGTLSSATLGWRIIVGILAGFAFFIFNSLLGQICIVYQVPPILSAILPLLAFMILGVLLSRRLITR